MKLYILHINYDSYYVCASFRSITSSLAKDRGYVIVIMQKGMIFCRMLMLN